MKRGKWEVRKVEGGWGVFYDGLRWLSPPREDQQDCIRYMNILADRHDDGAARLVLSWQRDEEDKIEKGGPWRYEYTLKGKDYDGVIHTSRLKDAKAQLRRELDRQRLPNGIEWEIAT